MKPRNQYVLVEKDQIEEATEGGILLADQTKEELNAEKVTATVLAVGPGSLSETGVRVGTDDLVPGARVILRRYSLQANTVVNKDKGTMLVSESDILAIVE